MNDKLRRFFLATLVVLSVAALVRGYVYTPQQSVWTPGSIPVKIKLGSAQVLSDGTNHSTSVQIAMQTWNGYLGTVQFVPQIVAPGAQEDYVSDIYFDSTIEGQAFGDGVLAVTLTYTSPSIYEIFETDIIFNTAWTWDSYRGNLQVADDIRRVALHELGHVLGLGHPDLNGQTVDALMNSMESNRDGLAQDDIDGAQSLYRAPGQTYGPGNDNFANATTVSLASGSTQATGTNLYATKEPGEPNHATETGGASVWWRWTAPANGDMTISTQGSKFDTVMGVYTGSTVSALSEVASNDDVTQNTARYSSVTFAATNGVTYSIAVDGWNGASGPVTLGLTFTPAFVATPPSITSHPASTTVASGTNASFTVVATGTGPLTYQWQYAIPGESTWSYVNNGGGYSGATTATLTVTASAAVNGYYYRCLVYNSLGYAATDSAILTVTSPPLITTHPSSQSIVQGNPVTFTATASGTPTPSYQWQKNGVNISGATGSSYTIASVAPSDAATYRVVATNIVGSATSNGATLTVLPPGPTITNLSPTRQVFVPGQSLNLSVNATGAGAITYQWVHNGREIPGATGSSLSLGSLLHSDGGWYLVLATDSTGTRRSAPFFVSVVPTQTQVRAWGTNTDGVLAIPAGLTTATAVSAGGNFALALKSDGTVVSWGSNAQGQGNVPAGLTGVVKISAGYGHALALKSDGTVVGWGASGFTALVNIPAGLSDVVEVVAANAHSLALRSDGTVVGWGQNISGETTPPAGLTGVVEISAGFEFSVALKSDGTVVAWGDNFQGKTNVPVGLSGVVAIAAGDAGHTLALKSDGTVVAWGRSNEGQTLVPAGLNHVVMIAAGERHSVALKDDGTVVMWGNLTSVPSDLAGVLAVSAGFGFSMGLCNGTLNVAPTITTQPANTVGVETATATFSVTAVGAAPLSYQWRKSGSNIPGATSATLTLSDLVIGDAGNYDVVVSNYLGSATSTTATLTVNAIPVVTNLSSGLHVIQPGQSLNLSVTATGTGTLTYQWTHNGQLIAGATSSSLTIPSATAQTGGWYLVFVTDANGTRRSLPIRVLVAPAATQVRAWSSNSFWVNAVPPNLTGVLTIAAGQGRGLALRQNGTVVVLSNNSNDQASVPAGLGGVQAIAGGNGYWLAMKGDGTVVGWGSNNYGAQLVPAGLTAVVDVSAGDSHAVALMSNGRVVAWGSNNYYQTNIPSGLKNVFTLSAGGFHTLAIKDDGTVVAWGENGSGQLQVPAGLNNVVAVAAGYAHSLALKSDGTVVGWGSNSYGETTVPAGLNGVIAIAAARYHSLALKADGTVVAWGSTSDGNTAAPADLAGVYAIADGTGFSLALRDVTGEAAPIITTQPTNLSLAQGQRATFTVLANGLGTLAYQWRKNGVNIAGATHASFIIAELAYSDAGNYDVVVSNYIGSVTSAIAVLTVNPPAVITSLSPTRQVLSPGQSLNLSVTATGVGALSYQWTRNGRPIAGATGSTYAVTGVGFADAGWYLVNVTDSNGTKRSAPIFVTVAPSVTEIRAWGANGYNELAIPAGLSDVVAIAAGDVTALALKRDGTVVAWGTDWAHWGNTTVPAGLSNVVAIAAGPFQALALKSNGTVVSWGAVGSPPAGLDNVVAIAANELHSLALKSDGTIVIWGGSQTSVPFGLTEVVGIAAPGHDASLMLRSDGTVAYWNADLTGQDTVPAGFSDAIAISSGLNHSLALKNDGTVAGWSITPYGSAAATVPAGLSGVVAIDAGGYHSLALKADGTVVAWGANDSGQASIPADLANVIAVSAGTWFSLALRDATPVFTPVITIQPSGSAVSVGGSTTFAVMAAGAPTPAYQWQRLPASSGIWSDLSNGGVYAGVATASLAITGATLAMNGDQFRCVATNLLGSATSNPATLTVTVPLPAIITQPASQAVAVGSPIDLSVVATSLEVLSYQWRKDGSNIPGAVAPSYSVALAQLSDAGSYTVVVTNSTGSVTSAGATVYVAAVPPVITTQPAAQTVDTGGPVTFTVVASSTAPLSYQWKKGGNPIGGATQASYTIGTVLPADAGNYTVTVSNVAGSVTSNAATLTVIPLLPTIITHPASQTAANGTSASFTVVATGKAPLAYQWEVSPPGSPGWTTLANDGTYSGVTTATLVVAASNAVNGYYFRCHVTNNAGYANTNSAILTVTAAIPPTITAHPQSQTVASGASASFTVGATGTAPLTYQWEVSPPGSPGWATLANDGTYSGVTTATLVVAASNAVNGYYFRCHVTNNAGYANTNSAILTVTVGSPPTITTQPQGQTVNVGADVTFSIVAGGTAPLTYQWRKGGADIGGATGTGYTLNGVTIADAGSYDVVVSNVAGSATSNAATLTVNKLAQTITFAGPINQSYTATPIPLSATANSGLPVTFAVATGPATVTGASLTLTGTGSVTVRASQFGDATYNAAPDVDQSFTVSGNFDSWALGKFTTGELADANISGPNAVFGHDGLPNLVKYALGLEPKQDITSGLPVVGTLGSDWIYTFLKPDTVTDVTCTVEVSTDLANWTPAGVTLELVSNSGGIDTWRARYPQASATNAFFRLKVTRP